MKRERMNDGEQVTCSELSDSKTWNGQLLKRLEAAICLSTLTVHAV